MRFLLSRPIVESEPLAKALAIKNIDSVIEPVLILKYLAKIPLKLNRFQALIFTSPNGIRAYNHHYKADDINVYCVGNKTSKMASDIGFKNVFSADGDLKKLSGIIKNSLNPENGPLLYLSGKHISGDLKAALEKIGFSVEKKEIYHMVALKNLSDKTKFQLENNNIDYIPFYSSRSALIFIELIKKANAEKYLRRIRALCLSPAIADVIKILNWQEIIIADKPTQYNLLQKINIEL